MRKDLEEDLLLSNSFLCYVYGLYQGKKSFVGVLGELGFAGMTGEELPIIDKQIARIEGWLGDLLKELPVFSRGWRTPETFDAKKVLDLLSSVKIEIDGVAVRVADLIRDPETGNDSEAIKFLIAAFTRTVYSRGNYVTALNRFGQHYNRTEMLGGLDGIINEVRTDSELAARMLQYWKNPTDVERAAFFTTLFERASLLPGMLRTQVHDVNQLLATYHHEGFTFETAEIPRDEVHRWQAQQFMPVAAGYWRAFELGPEEAAAWSQANIGVPQVAFVWRRSGFSPGDCIPWATKGFPPPIARAWADAGENPDRALGYVERGIYWPEQRPPAESGG